MALVTIVIQDNENGTVDIRLSAEPPIPCREDTAEDATPAHYLGVVALAAAKKAASSVDVEDAEFDDEDEDDQDEQS